MVKLIRGLLIHKSLRVTKVYLVIILVVMCLVLVMLTWCLLLMDHRGHFSRLQFHGALTSMTRW